MPVLPNEAVTLAAWFAEGVRSELAALEEKGGEQQYEVLSGKLIESIGATQAIFQFIIADGTRLPEDASGKLKTADKEYSATVIGQQANLIRLQIEGETPLLLGIPRAVLIVDDTVLLRRLAEVLEKTVTAPAISPLATTVFHPDQAKVGFRELSATQALVTVTGQKRRILEQACGSSLTYVWGPPGTGKTYVIAHLVAALVEAGERILVTSHTHAAVDQALYETVKSETDKRGPLAAHPDVSAGKILRIGRTTDRKIPESVRLDKVVESKAQALQVAISELEAKARPLVEKRTRCRAVISEWDKVAELETRLQSTREAVKRGQEKSIRIEGIIKMCAGRLQQRREELERAQRAWFGRTKKVERATTALRDAEIELHKAEQSRESVLQEIEKARRLAAEIEAALKNQLAICERFPSREAMGEELSSIAQYLDPIEEKIRSLQDEISNLEQKLILEARALFCTLTKNYTGKELDGQKFDAVIVDEISMALPPLVFLAAGRATLRVILVGDFLQLPPIVRSDEEISDERLGTDTFHLAGVACELKPAENCLVLTKLDTQRRMLPPIADVARHLVYNQAGGLEDDQSVLGRNVPAWLDFLPENPLVVVDTADLHCWSGKQPGSLSRFNFYSATLAVELAAMAAAKAPRPADGNPPLIGIVTPFAAQRRLLAKLVKEMELGEWVMSGTVHTFQGGEAELIIFDSVLDEPYWSARLANPRNSNDVKRDLNVAVTRAKSKFVFIGSSEWLNNHARPASGLGQMWSFLKDRANLISAVDLVELGFQQRVVGGAIDQSGWQLPSSGESPVHEILDEEHFFDRLASDMNTASNSIFGLVPYFGEYRWPKVHPLFSAALQHRVEITLVTPPLSEAENRGYVEEAIKNLRDLGAIVVSASGLHGKDIVIDERVHYTGSLNWASHRGRSEIMHRMESPAYAKLVMQFMQAKYIRSAAIHNDGSPRVCPICGGQTQVVNQRRQHGQWDFQAMKVGCANPECRQYLRNIDERPPFNEVPRCQVDGVTKYRRVTRRRSEVWECPKHPNQCARNKVVPGDPG